MSITETIAMAIIDATVIDTRTDEEVTDVSQCYVALAHDVEGTTPDGADLRVEWGPCRTRHREAVTYRDLGIEGCEVGEEARFSL